MKVLLINSVCGIRSTGRICTDLAQYIESKGHIVKIAFGRESVPEQYQKYAIRIGSETSVKLDVLKSRILDSAGFGSQKVTKNFINWVKEYDPDIIHLHNLHGYYINIEILFEYLKKSQKKIIWTLHDCWSFTGHCAHFDFEGCQKWKSLCNQCVLKKEYPSSYLLDRSKKNWMKKKELFQEINNMVIVTPSNWLSNLVKQSILSKYKILVINNGIDTTIFSPRRSNFREKYNLKDKKIILGVASTWTMKKGFFDFIKLARKLDSNHKIVLVGLSAKQKASIPDGILGIERTNDISELAEIYSAADVFLNLTYEDNFPTVNLEAQACGTPVITYETGGSVENVDNRYGFIVKKGDLSSVIAAIAKCTRKIPLDEIKIVDKQSVYKKYMEVYQR